MSEVDVYMFSLTGTCFSKESYFKRILSELYNKCHT